MVDITDGIYTGEMTPEQTIEQLEYRISIHVTYQALVQADPVTWRQFGSYEFHQWAINGYEHAIQYIKEMHPLRVITVVEYKCSLAEAMSTIWQTVLAIFGKHKTRV